MMYLYFLASLRSLKAVTHSGETVALNGAVRRNGQLMCPFSGEGVMYGAMLGICGRRARARAVLFQTRWDCRA